MEPLKKYQAIKDAEAEAMDKPLTDNEHRRQARGNKATDEPKECEHRQFHTLPEYMNTNRRHCFDCGLEVFPFSTFKKEVSKLGGKKREREREPYFCPKYFVQRTFRAGLRYFRRINLHFLVQNW